MREKKNLVPTDKGLAVYGIVKDKKIADVEMTGMWETALSKIEAGNMDADTFRKGIEVYATQITTELLSEQLSVATGETCPCPKCNNGRILFYPKVAKCSNVDCTLTIFRNKCDKQLSDKQIVELVTKRKTGLIKGFKGKNGKAFDASLVFLTEEPLQRIYELKQETAMLVVGGGKLLTSLIKAGLLDSLTIYTVPVMAGKGIGFIGETFGSHWKLSGSRMLDNARPSVQRCSCRCSPP